MRLIDGDTLLEQMKHRRDYVGRPSDPVCLVEDAPTVGGWVSVKDRLPGKNGRYLCRYEQDVDGKVCRCTDFGMFDSNIGEKGGWFVEKVAYWMPLPEPPKEVSVDG